MMLTKLRAKQAPYCVGSVHSQPSKQGERIALRSTLSGLTDSAIAFTAPYCGQLISFLSTSTVKSPTAFPSTMSSPVTILPLLLVLWVAPGLSVHPASAALDRIRRLEHQMKRDMTSLEDRLTDAFTKKLSQQNNTSSLFHVERFLQRLSGDLAAAAATEERREDDIGELQRRLAKQERKLHRVYSAIRRLQQTVSSATGQVQSGVSNSSRRKVGITPRPFVSKYPADCQDVYLSKGMKYPGSYVIVVQSNLSPKPFKVLCRTNDNEDRAEFIFVAIARALKPAADVIHPGCRRRRDLDRDHRQKQTPCLQGNLTPKLHKRIDAAGVSTTTNDPALDTTSVG
ncbi:hypothetical protein LSAT2_018482 [Lamellibrachia satsuma]|nr:hypothetical protein LSAT2_018482 [Lamellibrachia satsuma]